MGSCASVPDKTVDSPTINIKKINESNNKENDNKKKTDEPLNVINKMTSPKGLSLKVEKTENEKENQEGSPAVAHTTTVKVGFMDDGTKQINEYRIVKKIGQGSFGKVKLVVDEEKNELYAMKITSRSILKKMRRDKRGRPIKTDDMDLLLREIAILKQIDHPNIVKLHEVIDDPTSEKLYMIFEYIENGPVIKIHAQGKNDNVFSEAKARKYFRDLLKGLEYLHENRIIHRDIKPENLLLTNDDTLKVTDFGVSKRLLDDEDDVLRTNAGTPAFLSPEACKSSFYHGKPFDIWCCGITLYIFLYGELPFKGGSIVEMYNSILHEQPHLPSDTSETLKDLFHNLLNKDPKKRITLDELMTHPWITNNGMMPLTNKISRHSVSERDVKEAIRTGETCKLLDRMVILGKVKVALRAPIQRAKDNIRLKNEKLKQNNDTPEEDASETMKTSTTTYLSDMSSSVESNKVVKSPEDSPLYHNDLSPSPDAALAMSSDELPTLATATSSSL